MSTVTMDQVPATGDEKGIALKPMPLPFRAVGGVLDLLRWQPRQLDPDQLMRAAARRAGRPARFPDHIGESLEVMCRSIRDEADLHWFGRANLWELAVGGLASRLQLDAAFEADPSLAEEPLIPPLIVVGLPRSGTTFLHRLLADAEDARPVPFFEHLEPVRPRGPDVRRMRAEFKFWPWKRIGRQYHLDSIHYVRPGEADECNFSLRLSARSMVMWAMSPIRGYLDWLLDADMTETYQTYRRVMQLHQRANPGQRMTLKCPSHCAFLPALFDAFPEALVVQSHRSPETIAASEASLILALHATSVKSIDWRKTVDGNLHKVTTYAERSAAFADTEHGRKMHHVDYRRLVSEPVEVAREIREHFGIGFDDDHAERLAGYARRNKQHKRGRHRYSLEKYDLDRTELDRRFGRYRSRFARWLP